MRPTPIPRRIQPSTLGRRERVASRWVEGFARRCALGPTAVTDELLDAHVGRPLASRLVALVAPVPWITPNVLTAASVLAGALAAVSLVHLPWAAPALLLASMVIDCGDGQLARLRGGGTVLGRILDGYADYTVAIALHLGLVAAIVRARVSLLGAPLSPLGAFILVLAAGASQALHAAHFDFEKRRYWAGTGVVRAPETPETYLRAAAASRGLPRLLLRTFALYVGTQRAARAGARAPEARDAPCDGERHARYALEHAWRLRLWSLCGPTSHNGILLASACVAALHPGALAGYCVVALVAVNLVAGLVTAAERRWPSPREGTGRSSYGD